MSQVQIIIQIGVGPDGKLVISGPFHDKIQFFGFLEAAKVAVAAHNPGPAKPELFVAPPGTRIPEPGSNGHKSGR